MFCAIFPHVPLTAAPAAVEQAWHAVVHVELQQTPSTQKPLAHCAATVHVCPKPFTQDPVALQAPPPTHAPIGKLSCWF
jgi:hypothetical protein